ncbi:MAG: hypothetical protein KDA44_07705 [Planctomycetales bacterium]|nr:hypothetical protein [Planctomycetales bacterium]
MLVFLAILSVTNLALGFGLAVYLLRAGEMPAALLPARFAAQRPAPRQAAATKSTEEPAADEDFHAEAIEQSPAAAEPDAAVSAEEAPTETVAEGVDDPSAQQEPDVEEDVLAGIEAFRAQLAQMNDEPTAAEAESEAKA